MPKEKRSRDNLSAQSSLPRAVKRRQDPSEFESKLSALETAVSSLLDLGSNKSMSDRHAELTTLVETVFIELCALQHSQSEALVEQFQALETQMKILDGILLDILDFTECIDNANRIINQIDTSRLSLTSHANYIALHDEMVRIMTLAKHMTSQLLAKRFYDKACEQKHSLLHNQLDRLINPKFDARLAELTQLVDELHAYDLAALDKRGLDEFKQSLDKAKRRFEDLDGFVATYPALFNDQAFDRLKAIEQKISKLHLYWQNQVDSLVLVDKLKLSSLNSPEVLRAIGYCLCERCYSDTELACLPNWSSVSDTFYETYGRIFLDLQLKQQAIIPPDFSLQITQLERGVVEKQHVSIVSTCALVGLFKADLTAKAESSMIHVAKRCCGLFEVFYLREFLQAVDDRLQGRQSSEIDWEGEDTVVALLNSISPQQISSPRLNTILAQQ